MLLMFHLLLVFLGSLRLEKISKIPQSLNFHGIITWSFVFLEVAQNPFFFFGSTESLSDWERPIPFGIWDFERAVSLQEKLCPRRSRSVPRTRRTWSLVITPQSLITSPRWWPPSPRRRSRNTTRRSPASTGSWMIRWGWFILQVEIQNYCQDWWVFTPQFLEHVGKFQLVHQSSSSTPFFSLCRQHFPGNHSQVLISLNFNFNSFKF